MACLCSVLDRRTFLGLLGVGAAAVLAGCASAGEEGGPTETTTATSLGSTRDHHDHDSRRRKRGRFPRPRPGSPVVVSEGPPAAVAARQVAITIDDGYCQECAVAYVDFAAQTGTHITFSPNGVYHEIWSPLAPVLRPLIERGQVQIGNHTYHHLDMTQLSEAEQRAELERNDRWIERTFGITTRPWWRPPYGYHDEQTDTLAGDLGFTNVLMWNGSFGDSVLLTPDVLLEQATRYLEPGTIMLGHANHPTVSYLFPQIQALIAERGLSPVTLDEMFGTRRRTGS